MIAPRFAYCLGLNVRKNRDTGLVPLSVLYDIPTACANQGSVSLSTKILSVPWASNSEMYASMRRVSSA